MSDENTASRESFVFVIVKTICQIEIPNVNSGSYEIFL